VVTREAGGPPAAARRPVAIEVIFDLACPWCYIGKRHLEMMQALRPGLRTRVTWWPFLLTPDLPAGGVERSGYLLRKFGSETRSQRIHDAIARVGRAVGIDFAFERIQRTPNTVAAHRLVRFAATAGESTAMVEAVFRAFFVRGLDIGDAGVLVALAGEVGLDSAAAAAFLASGNGEAAVRGDNRRAHQLGINGVPAFLFDRSIAICGAQEPAVLARMLDVAASGAVAA
jgi:predicted DsbA family dithiol-disulfide isomerase